MKFTLHLKTMWLQIANILETIISLSHKRYISPPNNFDNFPISDKNQSVHNGKRECTLSKGSDQYSWSCGNIDEGAVKIHFFKQRKSFWVYVIFFIPQDIFLSISFSPFFLSHLSFPQAIDIKVTFEIQSWSRC